MRVLITGASGFVGKSLLEALPADWDVDALYLKTRDFPAFVASLNNTRLRAVRLDMADASAVVEFARGGGVYDLCIYLAANGDPAYSVTHPLEDLSANAVALINLLSHTRHKRFIFVSSGAVYDGLSGPVRPGVALDPKLPYAISKLASEHYCAHFHKVGHVNDLYVVRFFGAYGKFEPERKIYNRLVRRFTVERGTSYTIKGDGINLIDAMYIDDAVRALLVLAQGPAGSMTLDLAARQPLALRDLVKEAGAAFGVDAAVICEGSVPEYIKFVSADDTMEKRFQFKPEVSLRDGLRLMARQIGATPT